MKKVFIGCAAVLLSLGLLAGCDEDGEDKAVTIKVDNAATVIVGDSLELPYTVEPEKAEVEVLNDHEEYVTAEAEDGVLYLEGLAEGEATITLVGTYRKYEEANVNISVSIISEGEAEPEPGIPDTPTVSFSLSETSCDLISGDTIEIGYTVDPTEALVEATSDNKECVTAEVGSGVITLTGVNEGTATVSVTASYEDYLSATETISVSVTKGTVAVTGVTIDQGTEMNLAAGASTKLTATVTPENATNPSVTWAVTGDTGVITLDSTTGVVIAGSEDGSTEVTVTTVDGGYTDSITITVETAVVPEVVSIAFDSSKTYSVEVGHELDVANDVVATWKDEVVGDAPVYTFSMADNDYASLSGSVITGVASTYGLEDAALPVVTASIQGNSNVSPASQSIAVTEQATLTGISFTGELPTTANPEDTIDLSQYISITGTGDNWGSLVTDANVTYGLGETSTSVATISGSTVTIASNITADDTITVTAALADYEEVSGATATISVVAPLTIVSAAFKADPYDLTVNTEKDFAEEIEVKYNKEDSSSISYNVALSAYPEENLTIDGTKVTATGNVSATLTATITWGDGESTTCSTSISATAVVTELKNFTFELTLVDANNNQVTCPEYGELYLVGGFDTSDGSTWNTTKDHPLTQKSGSNNVYTCTLDSIDVVTDGTWVKYDILFCYTDHDLTWETILSGDEPYIIPTADLGDNYTYSATITCVDIATEYPELGSDVTVYFCLYDTAGGVELASIYMNVSDGDNIFSDGQGGKTYYCDTTIASIEVGGVSHQYSYNAAECVLEAGSSGHWVNWKANSGTQDYWIEATIPDDCDDVATLVCQADLSSWTANSTTSVSSVITGTWYSGDPATALATMLGISN